MTDTFNIPRTSRDFRSANQMAKGLAYDSCREKHGHLTRAASYGQWFVEALKDAGLPEHREDHGSDLRETLATVIDALNEAHGLIEHEADGENLAPEMFPLDIDELNALWREIGGV